MRYSVAVCPLAVATVWRVLGAHLHVVGGGAGQRGPAQHGGLPRQRLARGEERADAGVLGLAVGGRLRRPDLARAVDAHGDQQAGGQGGGRGERAPLPEAPWITLPGTVAASLLLPVQLGGEPPVLGAGGAGGDVVQHLAHLRGRRARPARPTRASPAWGSSAGPGRASGAAKAARSRASCWASWLILAPLFRSSARRHGKSRDSPPVRAPPHLGKRSVWERNERRPPKSLTSRRLAGPAKVSGVRGSRRGLRSCSPVRGRYHGTFGERDASSCSRSASRPFREFPGGPFFAV